MSYLKLVPFILSVTFIHLSFIYGQVSSFKTVPQRRETSSTHRTCDWGLQGLYNFSCLKTKDDWIAPTLWSLLPLETSKKHLQTHLFGFHLTLNHYYYYYFKWNRQELGPNPISCLYFLYFNWFCLYFLVTVCIYVYIKWHMMYILHIYNDLYCTHLSLCLIGCMHDISVTSP